MLVNPIFRGIMLILIEAMAVNLSNSEDAVVVGPTIRITTERISISITHMTHNQNNMVLPAVYAVDLTIPPSTCSLCGGFNHSPKHCYKGEHDINNIMEKMSINPSRTIYISNGDHDNPHEPPQTESEGCDNSQNTLYSHQINSAKESDDSKRLFYIYQDFQGSEKMHQIEPESDFLTTDDDSLYLYINNNIKYRLFEDIVDSYYLDSQI